MGNSSRLALTLAVLAAGVVRADPPDVLVLRSGGTLVGRVTREGNWYALRTLTGSGESRYPAGAVAKVCKGPLEAYEFLKASSTLEEPLDRCRLARFCISHSLFAEAQAELDAAQKLDARCNEAKALRAQLQLRKTHDHKTEVVVPALPSSPVLPLPAAKLDDWPLALTPAGFHDYGRRIQPILLTGCGTGACHGVSEGKRGFYLTRGLYGAPPSPLVTRANLERVLGLVNREDLDESLLLTKAHTPHGVAKAPPVDQDTYVVLRQWVQTMAGKSQVAARPEAQDNVFSASSPPATNGFAAGESTLPAMAAPSAAKPAPAGLPPIPGVTGGAACQLGQPEMKSAAEPPPRVAESPTVPPKIPGLSGKAAEQLGQKLPAPQPPPNPTPPRPSEGSKSELPTLPAPPVEPPKRPDPGANPAFWDFAKKLGYAPPAANVTHEPPKQMKLQNAVGFSVAYPPPPDIPDDVFTQLQRQARLQKGEAENAGPSRPVFLNTGTAVNSPKKP